MVEKQTLTYDSTHEYLIDAAPGPGGKQSRAARWSGVASVGRFSTLPLILAAAVIPRLYDEV
jgi:hypothetical protein